MEFAVFLLCFSLILVAAVEETELHQQRELVGFNVVQKQKIIRPLRKPTVDDQLRFASNGEKTQGDFDCEGRPKWGFLSWFYSQPRSCSAQNKKNKKVSRPGCLWKKGKCVTINEYKNDGGKSDGKKDDKKATPAKKKYCAHVCSEKRIRKDWALMHKAERELYQEAVKLLYDQGIYNTFVRIHQYRPNDKFAHHTNAFLPWHRKYLWELENALRCLGSKFSCVTIPYWDWAEWQYFCNELPGGKGCTSYDQLPSNMKKKLGGKNPDGEAGVTNILQSFGGPGDEKASGKCTYGGIGGGASEFSKDCPYNSGNLNTGVGCVTAGPFKEFEDSDRNCLSRGIDWKIPAKNPAQRNRPWVTNDGVLSMMLKNDRYKGFKDALQNYPHNHQHNSLGGHMRSMRSPQDPIFFSHHNMIEKLWNRWQDCVDSTDAKNKGTKINYEGNCGHRRCPHSDARDQNMPFKLNVKGRERDVGPGDFKRKDKKPYPYQWDHDKVGDKVADWIGNPGSLTPDGDGYHFQIDDFDDMIGDSACKMAVMGEGNPRFKEILQQREGMSVRAMKFRGDVEKLMKDKKMTVNEAVREVVDLMAEGQCAKQLAQPGCKDHQCTFKCAQEPQPGEDPACTFNRRFGGFEKGSSHSGSFCKEQT